MTLELFKWDRLGRMTFLPALKDHLRELVLYDCPDVQCSVEIIAEMKNLE